MEANSNDDILNSWLKTNFIDLNNVDTSEISKLNPDSILRESQKLVSDAVKNKTLEKYAPNQELKENNSKNEKLTEYRRNKWNPL